MSKNQNRDSDNEVELLRKAARLLQILVRLNLENLKADRSQKDLILLLDSMGCGPSEIAEILGTTPANVSPVLSRSKNGKRK